MTTFYEAKFINPSFMTARYIEKVIQSLDLNWITEGLQLDLLSYRGIVSNLEFKNAWTVLLVLLLLLFYLFIFFFILQILIFFRHYYEFK